MCRLFAKNRKINSIIIVNNSAEDIPLIPKMDPRIIIERISVARLVTPAYNMYMVRFPSASILDLRKLTSVSGIIAKTII